MWKDGKGRRGVGGMIVHSMQLAKEIYNCHIFLLSPPTTCPTNMTTKRDLTLQPTPRCSTLKVALNTEANGTLRAYSGGEWLKARNDEGRTGDEKIKLLHCCTECQIIIAFVLSYLTLTNACDRYRCGYEGRCLRLARSQAGTLVCSVTGGGR